MRYCVRNVENALGSAEPDKITCRSWRFFSLYNASDQSTTCVLGDEGSTNGKGVPLNLQSVVRIHLSSEKLTIRIISFATQGLVA